MVKNLPAIQEKQVQSLVRKIPLEEEIATHYNVLAWEIPWIEEPGGLQSMGLRRVGHDLATNNTTFNIERSPKIFHAIYCIFLKFSVFVFRGCYNTVYRTLHDLSNGNLFSHSAEV